MDYQLLIHKLNDIYNSPKPQSNKDFEKLYCNIMIYKNDIKINVSKVLFDKFKKETDDLMYEILLFDLENENNNDNYNKINSSFFIILKEIIEYLKSNFKFDEDHFISSILNEYYNGNGNGNGNDNNEIIDFIELFIEKYISKNSINYNIFLINKYSNINDAINLFKKYYRIDLYFENTKTDYEDLAFIVLFDYFYQKISKIIIDDYDSSNETIEEK
jgi:hypothetical protein